MRDWQAARDQWGPMVWKTLFRIVRNQSDALDCYQEVFLEAYEADLNRSINNLPGFLRWLAVRRGLDHLRRLNRSHRNAQRYAEALPSTSESADPGQGIEFEELVQRVRCELGRCPSDQAEAFWLCCVEQLSYADAAQQMGTSERNVGVLIHRARKRLRETLVDLRVFPFAK